MTPALFCLCFVCVSVAVVDPVARQIAADMRAAIDAHQSVKIVSLDLRIPLNKLYDQVNGNAPFTSFVRILAAYPDVRAEFYRIQAGRIDAVFVRVTEIRDLVVEVKALVATTATNTKRRMAKASLPDVGRKAEAV